MKISNSQRRTIAVSIVSTYIALLMPWQAALAQKCLFVSSYHQGYAWSDGVERGLRSVLADKCELKQFDMDTKRNKSAEDKHRAALEAKALVERWQPDVVITADDNAAKYLIQPYFKDSPIPFVFCGVNWTATEYGFPYSNVTGMVEVAPIAPMLSKAVSIAMPDGAPRAFYVGADTLTEEKNLRRFQQAAADNDMLLEHRLVGSTEAWLSAYQEGQGYDFLILGSNSGIDGWDPGRIALELPRMSRRLSVTNHGWMMPFAMLGMTKIPEEHGEWSAKTALAILGGLSPQDIPIISNRKWDIWANEANLKAAGVELPRALMQKAKRIN